MSNPVINLASAQNICQQCGIYRLCLPMGLSAGDTERLDQIIKRRRPLEKGEVLYQAGDDFHAIYALRSGSIKSFMVDSNGEEHVIGFKMPGDLLGLSGLNGKHYINSTVALEMSSVCEIPFDKLESLGQAIPNLQHHLMEIMSKEIQQEHEKVAICNKLPAEARLASILMTLSQRFHDRGFSANEFNLTMSRSDIANMLGMAVETVSRLFSQFQEQGILEVERKHVRLLDMEKLAQLIKPV